MRSLRSYLLFTVALSTVVLALKLLLLGVGWEEVLAPFAPVLAVVVSAGVAALWYHER